MKRSCTTPRCAGRNLRIDTRPRTCLFCGGPLTTGYGMTVAGQFIPVDEDVLDCIDSKPLRDLP